MKYEKGKLGLIIPSRHETEAAALTLEGLQTWRNQIPISDLNASIKSCYDILKTMHHSRIAPDERLEMVNIVSPTVSFLCESLIYIYKHNLSYRKKFLDLYRIILTLHLDLFTEYKISIEDTYTSNLGHEHLIDALFAALQEGSKIVFLSAEIYRNPPTYIWQEIHTLFNIAREKGIKDRALDDNNKWHNRLNNINNLYKHILLFALTNPLRYHRNDLTKIFYTLEAWAPLLSLSFDEKNNNTLFKVDLGKDAPPHYTALDKSQPIMSCFLEVDSILEHLERLVEFREYPKSTKTNFTTHELSLPINILQILMHTWQHCSQRQHIRKKSDGTMTVAVGMRAIHTLANNLERERKNNASKQVIEPDMEQDVEEINLDSIPLPYDVSEPFESVSPLECIIVDKSEGGFCFKCKGANYNILQSGEIVGVLEVDDSGKDNISMAVIRWVQVTDFDYALIGVELIANHVMGTTISSKEDSNIKDIKGLMMSSAFSANTHLLVTPTLRFNAKNEVSIEHRKQKHNCLLLENLGLSPCYAIWEVEYLDSVPQTLVDNPASVDNHDLRH